MEENCLSQPGDELKPINHGINNIYYLLIYSKFLKSKFTIFHFEKNKNKINCNKLSLYFKNN